jgi:hypothetical protein
MARVDQLKDLTKGLGGMFNEFSQSYAQIKSARSIPGLYTSDKQNLSTNDTDLYVGGMCYTMSMYWVIGQVYGLGANRSNFISWVMPGKDQNTINMEAVGVLVSKTVMYKAKGGRAQAQGVGKDPHFEDSFFARYNIKDKQEKYQGFDAIKKGIGRAKDRFYMVSYGSGTGGHACAAQTTSEGGYAYFDPNYGTASLFSKKAWEAWYAQYLVISTYSTKYVSRQSASGYKAKGVD